MRAYSTASGGVIFVPDEIEVKTKKKSAVSYTDIAKDISKAEKKGIASLFFSRRKKDADPKILEAA